MHALVFDISHTVQTEVRVALAKENGTYGDPCCGSIGVRHGEVDFSHVVQETRDGEDVQCAKGAFLYVIVSEKDREGRE
jgi:hypothetical protein